MGAAVSPAKRPRGGVCGHCGKAGHYRPTCPELVAARAPKPARRRAERARVEPVVLAPPRDADRDGSRWALTESHRVAGADPMVFTWEHSETGERVTATLPRPPGGWHETTEHLAVYRFPRDPVAYATRHLPSATVTRATREVSAPVAVVRPLDSAACNWGMW